MISTRKKIRGLVPDQIEDMPAHREFLFGVSDDSTRCVSGTGNVSER
jgi:hypothetical protein